MKAGVGVFAVARHGLGGITQFVLIGVMHNEAEFLLRRIRLGPHLTFFRQEDAAKQRGQFFIT